MNTEAFSTPHDPSTPSTDRAGTEMDRPQVDATRRLPTAGERALVLGGGGSTGNAWLIGVVAGLVDAGLDVTTADLTVGTSAGATAAAQLAGASLTELFALTVAAVPQRSGPLGGSAGRGGGPGSGAPGGSGGPGSGAPGGSGGPGSGAPGGSGGPGGSVADHLERMRGIIAAAADPADWRRKMGAAALENDAATDGAWSAQWRSIVEARLPSQLWPERLILLTAVDAQTGEPVVFDRDSGVDMVDAVAASTAGGGSAYRIGEGRYIDGGYRSNAENADLATGYRRVLVLSPLGGRSLTPPEWGLHVANQVDGLRAGGSRVETVVPESESEHLFGANAMDFSLRPAAAHAGYDQGTVVAAQLSEFWG